MDFDLDKHRLEIAIVAVISIFAIGLAYSAVQDKNNFESPQNGYPKVVEEDVEVQGKVATMRAGSTFYTVIGPLEEDVIVYGGLPENLTERNVTVKAKGDMVKYKITVPVASDFKETTLEGLNITEYTVVNSNEVEAGFGAEKEGVNAEKGEINLSVPLSIPNPCQELYVSGSEYNESVDAVAVDIDSKDECDDNEAAPSVIRGPIPRMMQIEVAGEMPEKIYVDHFERKEFNVSNIRENS